jgi:hypothetical protein
VSLYQQPQTLTRAVFAHFIWGGKKYLLAFTRFIRMISFPFFFFFLAPTKLRAMQAYQTLWVKNEDCHLLPRDSLDQINPSS